MTAPTPRAGVTVTDEAVELAANELFIQPDAEELNWTYNALTAALPRLVEQISAGIAEAIRARLSDPLHVVVSSRDYALLEAANIALAYGKDHS